MNIKIVYPKLPKSKRNFPRFVHFIGMLFIIASIISIGLNIILKGKPWSLIVVLGLYMLWIFIFSPTLIEYNRIDQFIKLLVLSCLLLHIIDLFFARGFGIFVIPICLFSGIIFASLLLFTDYESQKHNIFPVYLLLIFCLIIGIIAINSDVVEKKWVYYVLLGVSIFYLFVCSFIVKNNIFKEIKKRFTIK